ACENITPRCPAAGRFTVHKSVLCRKIMSHPKKRVTKQARADPEAGGYQGEPNAIIHDCIAPSCAQDCRGGNRPASCAYPNRRRRRKVECRVLGPLGARRE